MPISYFYITTICFLLGVFTATVYSVTLPTIAWLMFIGFISILIWYRSTQVVEVKSWLLFGIVLVAFSLGALRIDSGNSAFNLSTREQEVGETVTVNGVIKAEPEVRESVTHIQIKTDNGIILALVDRYEDVSYGDVVVVTGELSKPESFVTDYGRTFNYQGYLKAKGISYVISFANLDVLEHNQGNFFISALLQFKHSFTSKIETVISEPAAGLGEGLLLGIKQSLGEELEEAFRETGIIHIVVLSGYNIMLVVVFVMYILGHFLSKKPRAVVGIMAIVAFAFLVGLSATVVRASIMATLLIVMQATGRTYLVMRGLLIAGAVMILLNPFLLVYDVGFQLSFLATLGLILISPHLERVLTKIPNLLGARSFLVATLSTQLAVLPLLLYQIGQFSVVAVIVNVLVLPIVPVAMLLTFLTGMSSFVSTSLATVLSFPTYLALTYINTVALWFAELPFASFIVSAFSFYWVVIAYFMLGFVLWKIYRLEFVTNSNDLSKLLLSSEMSIKGEHKENLNDWVIDEENDKPINKKDVARSATSLAKPDTKSFSR